MVSPTNSNKLNFVSIPTAGCVHSNKHKEGRFEGAELRMRPLSSPKPFSTSRQS